MANIKVNDLKPTGTELFLDTESFMNDLGDDEMSLRGGDWSTFSGGCGSVQADEWSTFSNQCRPQAQVGIN
ncbi:hypothetical protein [Moorena sp. SIO3H5]|uniref:hypothetical protein n=1 Tax=Moorena sp. SIO3H5 TaxID=2607834 RepID=UPI0013B833DB|nr:hypothetical protein [Moorena sp. SIO3H5]NEO68990.1 hypothetical protein [Moorena sp. SIO3H5]